MLCFLYFQIIACTLYPSSFGVWCGAYALSYAWGLGDSNSSQGAFTKLVKFPNCYNSKGFWADDLRNSWIETWLLPASFYLCLLFLTIVQDMCLLKGLKVSAYCVLVLLDEIDICFISSVGPILLESVLYHYFFNFFFAQIT